MASCWICVFILFSDHSLQNTCERQSKRDRMLVINLIRIVPTRNPMTGKLLIAILGHAADQSGLEAD